MAWPWQRSECRNPCHRWLACACKTTCMCDAQGMWWLLQACIGTTVAGFLGHKLPKPPTPTKATSLARSCVALRQCGYAPGSCAAGLARLAVISTLLLHHGVGLEWLLVLRVLMQPGSFAGARQAKRLRVAWQSFQIWHQSREHCLCLVYSSSHALDLMVANALQVLPK
jgi:hypothetical protein